MTQLNPSDMQREILTEILQQPQALKELAAFYSGDAGRDLLDRLPAAARVVFCASGSALTLARWAAYQCRQAGIPAQAVETAELVAWPSSLFNEFTAIFCLSASGENASLSVLRERDVHIPLIVLSATPETLPAHKPELVLPLCAGPEKWRGSKTLVNLLALTWLVGRRLTGQPHEQEAEQLKRLRQHVQLLLEGRAAIIEQWRYCLSGADHLLLCGQGRQVFLAELAGHSLADWAGVLASVVSIQSLQEDYLSWLAPGWAVIVCEDEFASSETRLPLWPRIEKAGAQVVLLHDGFPQRLGDPARPIPALHADLAPLLNFISCQLLALSL